MKKKRQFDKGLLDNDLNVHYLIDEQVTKVYDDYVVGALDTGNKPITIEQFKRQSLEFFPYIRTGQGFYRLNPKMI